MLTGIEFYLELDLVPKKPPGDLTKNEYHWYLRTLLDRTHPYQQSTIIELMMVYEMIDKHQQQGEVMSQWIKGEYQKKSQLKEQKSDRINMFATNNTFTPYLNGKQNQKHPIPKDSSFSPPNNETMSNKNKLSPIPRGD